jgi:hypothetical protein
VIVVQLWIVLTTYRDVVTPAFSRPFVVTVLLSSDAFSPATDLPIGRRMKPLSPTEYITHHLTFFTHPVKDEAGSGR